MADTLQRRISAALSNVRNPRRGTDVVTGDMVEKEQEIGRSGMTGLAGGDHLHFTMLVNGHMVNPVEWWDQHWIDDRVERKLRESR